MIDSGAGMSASAEPSHLASVAPAPAGGSTRGAAGDEKGGDPATGKGQLELCAEADRLQPDGQAQHVRAEQPDALIAKEHAGLRGARIGTCESATSGKLRISSDEHGARAACSGH